MIVRSKHIDYMGAFSCINHSSVGTLFHDFHPKVQPACFGPAVLEFKNPGVLAKSSKLCPMEIPCPTPNSGVHDL